MTNDGTDFGAGAVAPKTGARVLGGRTASGAMQVLDPLQASNLLKQFGVPVVEQVLVSSVAEVRDAADSLAGPVVLKGIVPGVSHRSDLDAVSVGIRTGEEAELEARRMASAIEVVDGYLIQQYVEDSCELIVGIRRDPVFGPFVVVGLGGVWVELLNDTAIRPATLEESDADEMLRELKAAPVLEGYRGSGPVDREGLISLIVAVGRLAVARPDVIELDLNPVIAGPDRVVAVDMHIALQDAATVGDALRGSGEYAGGADLDALFRPSSIAVVGASSDPQKPGGRLMGYLLRHGYEGELYPVNPGGEPVMGLQTYVALRELPRTPDLVCVAVRSEAAVEVVEEAARLGVPAAIVLSSGFGEVDDNGLEGEQAMAASAHRGGMRLSGPNTAGIMNSAHAMCATIAMAFEAEDIPKGNIALVSQSGAIGSSLASRAWADGIGFSSWVSCGNEADLTLADYVYYLVDDPQTRVIAVFMEAVRDGERFIDACRRARSRGIPIVVYKTGRTELGQQAVASHTAALAGDDSIYDVIFRANGLVRVHELQGLLDASMVFAWQPAPRGNRVGVLSASGGACSVVADQSTRLGLALPSFSGEGEERLREVVPSFGVATNPLDLTMEVTTRPQMVGEALEVLLDEELDAVLVMLTTNAGPGALQIAQDVTRISATSTKTIVVARLGAEYLAPEAVAHYRAQGTPIFPTPERALAALGAVARWTGDGHFLEKGY